MRGALHPLHHTLWRGAVSQVDYYFSVKLFEFIYCDERKRKKERCSINKWLDSEYSLPSQLCDLWVRFLTRCSTHVLTCISTTHELITSTDLYSTDVWLLSYSASFDKKAYSAT
jgi:hypothetical protein